ncbi:endo-1,4-beta-xylanase [Hamadaea tsunoensis]|uniref:endo-1,4-beta-xylanase n=1 Tax=Hamadaea tsunoensis TaxID=53368 RepID=UPI0003FB3C3E|nr:endo-1,4-beta-xylanase [Hamadaea tsunoensis]
MGYQGRAKVVSRPTGRPRSVRPQLRLGPLRRSRSTRVLAVAAALVVVWVAVVVVVIVRMSPSGHDRVEANPPATPTVSASPSAAAASLRTSAGGRVHIGTAMRPTLLDNVGYADLVAREFDSVTAENAMKWTEIQRTPDDFDFATADRIIAFAAAHDQVVYGHTLLWHSNVPTFVNESTPPDVVRDEVRTYVQTVAARYRGKIWAWDAVNEPLNPDGTPRDSIWRRKLGDNYIADVFRWVHEADPGARLFINDFGIEVANKKSDALLNMVRQLRNEGVPVGGVGFQTHIQSTTPLAKMKANLQRFAALGIKVAITELDVRIQLPTTPATLDQQAAQYAAAVRACLAVPACASITVWGFSDALSWIDANYKGWGAACLFDTQDQPKPAYQATLRALRGS